MTDPAKAEGQFLWLDELLGDNGVSRVADEVRNQLQRDVKKAGFKIKTPSLLTHAVADQLAGKLHVDVLGFLAEGWNTASELEECRRRSREQPGATFAADIGRHTISRELKPEIEVSYAVVSKPFKVDAAIAIEGTFEGVALSFRNGQMVKVGSGHCDAEVQLKLGGKAIRPALAHRRWTLPGEYSFVQA